jgi:uncharacterized membrane protein
LEAGGIDWPVLPGFEDLLPTENPTPEITIAPTGDSLPTEVPRVEESPTTPSSTKTPENALDQQENDILNNFRRDIYGNSASVVVLAGMILCLTAVPFRFRDAEKKQKPRSHMLIPVLSLIGLAVAGYLTYVEMTNTLAICGPVGDCNTVQQSPYAVLFGILPVGLLGLVGYTSIMFFWALQLQRSQVGRIARIGLWVLSLIGILVSIYLTFLEPFVIGATCAWCLSSAVIMTSIFWISSSLLSADGA